MSTSALATANTTTFTWYPSPQCSFQQSLKELTRLVLTMAFGTNLPIWPAIVFTFFEPGKLHNIDPFRSDTNYLRWLTLSVLIISLVSLIIGFYTAFFDPTSFVSRQLPPTSVLTSSTVPPHAQILSLSIANMFIVQCLLSLLFTVITRESRLTKYYLSAAALGDLGHIYASYAVMGKEMFWDFDGYNDMMVGNVLVSAFLWVNRTLTLLGVFGRVGRRT
jgi:hypothetical protein